MNPAAGVSRRVGEGVRVFWDRLREPSFTSRWNPFTLDYPYMTFTDHPVRATNDKFSTLCDVSPANMLTCHPPTPGGGLKASTEAISLMSFPALFRFRFWKANVSVCSPANICLLFIIHWFFLPLMDMLLIPDNSIWLNADGSRMRLF